MTELIVACVRTGTRYPIDYVERLRNMVSRYLLQPYRFVCLTDRPQETCRDVEFVDVSNLDLPRWWAKMALFRRAWRGNARVVFLDLDTVIIGPLSPLAEVRADFAICENFTRASGNLNWPCRYGSCVMVIGAGWHEALWNVFNQRRDLMTTFARFGDQKAIEELYPCASLLQPMLGPDYFMGYRQITERRPRHTSVVNFGGNSKPHNCHIKWVEEAWR